MAKMSYSIPEKLLDKDYSSTMDSSHFYQTSNKRDYKGLPGDPADNARPGTSDFYSQTPTGGTSYDKEFGWKVVQKEESGRPGTASGQRKNNPHPKETFMVWKFQNELPREQQAKMKEELMQEICQDKIRSTYEVDYTGLKQGEKGKICDSSKLIQDKRNVPQYTLNTTVRVDYQKQEYKGNLDGNTTRYGCNEKKVIPAVGVVPTVIHRSPPMKTRYNTSYTDEFEDKEENEFTNKASKTKLSEYLKKMSLDEKKVIVDMLKTVNGDESTSSCANVERISQWDGPSWK